MRAHKYRLTSAAVATVTGVVLAAGCSPAREPESEGRARPPVSDPACQPLIDVPNGEGAHARVFQVFDWKDNIMGGSSALASFEQGEAERRFAEVEKALTTCRSYEGESYMGPIKATVRPERAPQVGDEAVAFRETIPVDPESQDNNEHTVVVRVGNTIATFSELNIGAGRAFPTDLIALQVEHLRNAQRP